MPDITALEIDIQVEAAVRHLKETQKQLRKTGESARVLGGTLGETEQGLSIARHGFNSFGNIISNTRRHISRILSPITDLKTVIIAFGAGSALSKSVNTFSSFQTQLSRISVVSGATTDEMQRLKQVAENLGATTVFSQDQVASGLLTLARSGKSVSEQIALIKPTMDLATAGAINMDAAAGSLTTALAQFGLTTNSTIGIADLLVRSANAANQTMSQLTMAMGRAGGAANAVGLSIQDTALAISALANAGVTSEMAGVALAGFLSRLANLKEASGEAAKTMRRLGLQFEEINPKAHSFRNIIARLKEAQLEYTDVVTLFGEEAGRKLVNVINAGAESIDLLSEKMKLNSDAAVAALNNIGSLERGFTELKSSATATLSRIGESLETLTSQSLKSLTNLSNQIRSFLTEHEASIETFSRVVIKVAGVISDVVNVVFQTLRMLLNQILVTSNTAFKGLLSGFKTILDFVAPFSDTAGAMAKGVGSALDQVNANIRSDLEVLGHTSSVLEKILSKWLGIKTSVEDSTTSIEKQTKAIEQQSEIVKNKNSVPPPSTSVTSSPLENSPQIFTQMVSSAGPNAARAVQVGEAFAKDPMLGVAQLILSNEKVKQALDNVFEAIFKLVDPIIDLLAPVIDALIETIKPFKPLLDSLLQTLKPLMNSMRQLVSALGKGLGKLGDNFSKAFQPVSKFLETNITKPIESFSTNVSHSINGLFGGGRKKKKKDSENFISREEFLDRFDEPIQQMQQYLDQQGSNIRAINQKYSELLNSIRSSKDLSAQQKLEAENISNTAQVVELSLGGFFDAAREAAQSLDGADFEKATQILKNQQIRFLNELIQKPIDIIDRSNLGDLEFELQQLNESYLIQAAKLQELDPELRDYGLGLLNQAKQIEENQIKTEAWSKALKENEARLKEQRTLVDQLSAMEDAIENVNLSSDEFRYGLDQIRDGLSNQRDELIRQAEDLERQGKAFTGSGELFEKKYEIIKSFNDAVIREEEKFRHKQKAAFESALEPIEEAISRNTLGNLRTEIGLLEKSFEEAEQRTKELNAAAGGEDYTGLSDLQISLKHQKALQIKINELLKNHNDLLQEETDARKKTIDQLLFSLEKRNLSPLLQDITEINNKYSDLVQQHDFSVSEMIDIAKSRSKELAKSVEDAFDPFFKNLEGLKSQFLKFRGQLVGSSEVSLEQLSLMLETLQQLGSDGVLDEVALNTRVNLMEQIFDGVQKVAEAQKEVDDNHKKSLEQLRSLSKSLKSQLTELLLSDFNIATPEEKLSTAQSKLNQLKESAFAAAQTISDVDDEAIESYQQFAEKFLKASQEVFKSGQGHLQNFNQVIADLNTVDQLIDSQVANEMQREVSSVEQSLVHLIDALFSFSNELSEKVDLSLSKLLDVSINLGGENIEMVGGVPTFNTDMDIVANITRSLEGVVIEGTVGSTTMDIHAEIQRFAEGGVLSGQSVVATYDLLGTINRLFNGQEIDEDTATSILNLVGNITKQVNGQQINGEQANWMLEVLGSVIKKVDNQVIDNDSASWVLNVVGGITKMVDDQIITGDTKNWLLSVVGNISKQVNGQTINSDQATWALGVLGTITQNIMGGTISGNTANWAMAVSGNISRAVTGGQFTDAQKEEVLAAMEIVSQVSRQINDGSISGNTATTIMNIIGNISKQVSGGTLSGSDATASLNLLANFNPQGSNFDSSLSRFTEAFDVAASLNVSGSHVTGSNSFGRNFDVTSSINATGSYVTGSNSFGRNFETTSAINAGGTYVNSAGNGFSRDFEASSTITPTGSYALPSGSGFSRTFYTWSDIYGRRGSNSINYDSASNNFWRYFSVEADLTGTLNGANIGFSGASGQINADISATANLDTGLSNLEKTILFVGAQISQTIVTTKAAQLTGSEWTFLDFARYFALSTVAIFDKTSQRVNQLFGANQGIQLLLPSIIPKTVNGNRKAHFKMFTGPHDDDFNRNIDSDIGTIGITTKDLDTFGEGGLISGPSHSLGGVDINAEGGEFVVNRQTVQRVGLPFLESMNGGDSSLVNHQVPTYSTQSKSSSDSLELLTQTTNQKLDQLIQKLEDKDLSVQVDVDTEELIDAKILTNNKRIQHGLKRHNQGQLSYAFA